MYIPIPTIRTKAPASNTLIPATKRWCPHVRNPTPAIPIEEYAIALYDFGFFRENVHTSSVITPIEGSTMM